MIFLKKYLEIWYFLQVFWKDGLSRKFAPEHDHFCNIWRDGIYFFQKTWYFFFGRKMKEDDRYQKTRGKIVFLYIFIGVTSTTLPPKQKHKDALALKKYT